MLHIAGAIILAVILWHVGTSLFALMFSGFESSTATGCVTMVVFGAMLFGLGTCVFG